MLLMDSDMESIFFLIGNHSTYVFLCRSFDNDYIFHQNFYSIAFICFFLYQNFL